MEGDLDFSLEFESPSRDRSRIATVAGLERDIAAIHFAVFDRGRGFASAEEASRALDCAGKAASTLVQREDHGSIADEEGECARSSLLRRDGPPQASDAGADRNFAPPRFHLRTERNLPGVNRHTGCREAGGCSSNGDAPLRFGGLDNRHAKAGEGLSGCTLVGFLVRGIAIANADQLSAS